MAEVGGKVEGGMNDIRIIVCGPRDHSYGKQVYDLCAQLKERHGEALVIVHGGCRTGVDACVQVWCSNSGVTTECNFADWEKHSKPAGPRRNGRMAARGAQHCYGVMIGANDPIRGTRDMMRQAHAAGIETSTVKMSAGGGLLIERWEP